MFMFMFNLTDVYLNFFRSVADRFGVSKDTVWKSVFEVAMLLTENAHRYIKWPKLHEMSIFEREFRQLHGFPGVIGAIDGSHIAISAPIENHDNYINRKGYHSIILQGICDYKLKFIDVFTGICGSVHDARVWRLSDIRTLIVQDKNRYFQNKYHLLADSAYPLSKYMLTPYRDNGHLTNVQRKFNTKLSKTRLVIERAFGTLKGRFRKLKYIYMFNTEIIPLVIFTCCILHNICIENEDAFIDEFDEAIEMLDDDIALMNGAEKRDIISNLL